MADETGLGRPARHERPKTKRRAPGQVKTAAAKAGRVRCAECGGEFEVEALEGMPSFMVELRAEQLAGGKPWWCGPCSDRLAEAERQALLTAEREESIAGRRRKATLPPKWDAQTFADLDDDGPRRRALTRAGEWARGELAGLVLWGPVGRGKTAIAAAAANLRLQRSGVRWLSVAELLLELRMPFDSPEYLRAQRRLDAARGRVALVLDDLDKLKPTEHAVQPLYVAVNGWIEAELPLLVTLNRDLDELEAWMPETFGEALASRLSGYCATVEVGGRDRRIEP